MYNSPTATPSRGLGQMNVIGYGAPTAGRPGITMADLCSDTLFSMMNADLCAPSAPSVAPPAPAPPPTPPPAEVQPRRRAARPAPGNLLTTFAPEAGVPIDVEAFEAPAAAPPTVVTVGGGGWGPSSPAAQLTVGPTEVFVEAEEADAPGFGIVEVALAAGVAWVLSQSYRKRGR